MDNKPAPSLLPAGGLHQRLIKAWRMKPVGLRPGVEVGLYICPSTGVLYARVPEQDEGTLYTARSRPELRDQVQEALKAWMDEAADLAMHPRALQERAETGWWCGRRQAGDAPRATEPVVAGQCG